MEPQNNSRPRPMQDIMPRGATPPPANRRPGDDAGSNQAAPVPSPESSSQGQTFAPTVQTPTPNAAPSQPAINPIESAEYTNHLRAPADPDAELDDIIDEVHGDSSAGAKIPEQPAAAQAPAVPKEPRSSKPVLVAVIALLVAAALAVVAFFAFRNNRPATQSSNVIHHTVTTAAPTAVTSQEASQLSQELTTQSNSLNDTQDFNAADYSDQTLGLQ
jgi:hypothetical protein